MVLCIPWQLQGDRSRWLSIGNKSQSDHQVILKRRLYYLCPRTGRPGAAATGMLLHLGDAEHHIASPIGFGNLNNAFTV